MQANSAPRACVTLNVRLAIRSVGSARELAFLVGEHDLDATVLLATCGVVVPRHRKAFALADRLHSIAVDAARCERLAHGIGTMRRQLLVVLIGAAAVRV